MKKKYQQPRCNFISINAGNNILSSSFGEIGGKTNHFDAPRRNRLLDFEDDEDENW